MKFWGSTFREYNLARQGHERQFDRSRRREAGWMSVLLSTLTGNRVTQAELLGEDEPGSSEEEQLAASAEFEKKRAAVMARRAGRA